MAEMTQQEAMRQSASDWLLWIKCKLRFLEHLEVEPKQQFNLIRMKLRLAERIGADRKEKENNG
jgi:hypothetical protein